MPINLNSGVIDDISVNNIANVTQVPSVTAQAGLRSNPSLVLNFAGNVYYSASQYAYSAAGIPGYTFTRASGGYAETVAGGSMFFPELRTNLLLQSQFASGWTAEQSTVSFVASPLPDGSTSSSVPLLTEASTTAVHDVYQSLTLVSGTNYATSVYVKANTATECSSRKRQILYCGV